MHWLILTAFIIVVILTLALQKLNTMKKILTLLLIPVACIVVFADILNEDGKAGRTGSPGEFDCTGCHTSFPVNTGGGSITISSPNLTNWQYIPGQVYQIDVTVAKTGVPLFGFGFESLRSTGANAGTFTITNTAETQLKNANINGNNRSNVVHKENGGLTMDSHTFSFNWTAPATNIGNITFYTAGNAGDNQGDSLGDYIYKTSRVVTPTAVGINAPIFKDGVNIYPTPVSTELNITCNELKKLTSVTIADLKGNVVYTHKLTNPAGSFQLTNPYLENGFYLLNFNLSDGSSGVKKILVFKEIR